MLASGDGHHCEKRGTPWLTTLMVDGRGLRGAGVVMMLASVMLPLVPGYPGVACPLRAVTGVPCPFCGMTTSVRESLHLDLKEAFAANPAGILAVLTALALVVLRPARVSVPQLLIPLLLVGMWVFELFRFSVL